MRFWHTREGTRMGTLASVHIYPLKGGRGVDLAESAVEPCGLAGDRRWLLVDSDFRFISQREHASLARLTVRYGPGADISVSSDGYPSLRIPAPGQAARPAPEMLTVTVWRSTVLAAAAGPAADAWFSAYLSEPVRLVYLDDPTRRAVDPEFGADGLGLFRVAKPCGRCLVTTTDQLTGERGREPLAMLGRRRRFGEALVFGQNLIPDSPGLIRVGDPVEITAEHSLPDGLAARAG
jgi:MOSC domain-containing protein